MDEEERLLASKTPKTDMKREQLAKKYKLQFGKGKNEEGDSP